MANISITVPNSTTSIALPKDATQTLAGVPLTTPNPSYPGPTAYTVDDSTLGSIDVGLTGNPSVDLTQKPGTLTVTATDTPVSGSTLPPIVGTLTIIITGEVPDGLEVDPGAITPPLAS